MPAIISSATSLSTISHLVYTLQPCTATVEGNRLSKWRKADSDPYTTALKPRNWLHKNLTYWSILMRRIFMLC